MKMSNTAIVTGGTRGIGLGIATELAKAGFRLAVNGTRDADRVRDSLDHLNALGPGVFYIQADISKKHGRDTILNRVVAEFGHLNVLVNNAGIAPPERRDIMEAGEESYDLVMDVNLKGPYFLTQLIARHMVEAGKGDPEFRACIINISSISSVVASVNRGEYCISKAGVSMATRLWAARLGEHGIPVYEIQPGIIETDMTSGVKQKYDRMIEDGLCVQKRWGTPEDVGKVAAAMATGSLPYSTGQVVVVDGGLTIPRL
jgi:3-oxoacyl-[acyl-carrier protein] reductase